MILYFKKRFSFFHIVFLIMIILFYQLPGRIFVGIFPDFWEPLKIFSIILRDVFMEFSLFLYIFLIMKKSNVSIKSELNIDIKKIDILWGLLAYPISIAILLMLDYLLPINSIGTRVTYMINYLVKNSHYFILSLLLLYGSFLGPVFEEIIFRGFLWKIFQEKNLNKYMVLVIISFLFAIFHLEFYMIPVLFVSGLVFGFLRMRTNRLGTSIIAHAISNIIAMVSMIVFYLK